MPFSRGLSNMAESAGESDSALNAEMTTEIAIVTVSADSRQADRVIAAALSYVEGHAGGAQVADVSTELLPL